MNILVTGGTGFIGSHTIVSLLEAGHSVVAIDNLSNSDAGVIGRLETLTNRPVPFVQTDIRDRAGLESVFAAHDFDACIHFAGLKAVGESVEKPWEYYENNIGGTLVLLDVMRRHGCKNIVFSSSSTVYGDPAVLPVTEDAPTGGCSNPYGRTKYMIEQILTDMQKADPDWNIVLLRYFNPIGAHPSGLIGERPNGIPNNLLPYITQVAAGEREFLNVWGDDYDTPDGTGIRDYIHVIDLAEGHVAALRRLEAGCGLSVYNLGTGRGYSVLEVVHAFEEASSVRIPYRIMARRPGDIPVTYADPGKAERELGWKAARGIREMCADAWRWQQSLGKEAR